MSLITEKDLQEAIAECQGQRNPNASTCIKLAAFLTIRNELFGNKEELPTYSFASQPTGFVQYDGESEFAKAIQGKDQDFVFRKLDELMKILSVTQPKLYDGVLQELEE